ncbi:hypothetical protein ABT009_18300 [Streptomyces sp. NPDC002896]|uniref:hypothetical protein n=1 Tax=Streptomyces sp. NPDC002896 TaxID=3154438 RepID=UPI003322DB68
MSEGSEAYGWYGTTPYRADGTASRAAAYLAHRGGRYGSCPTPRRQGVDNPFPAHVIRVSARRGPVPEQHLFPNSQRS